MSAIQSLDFEMTRAAAANASGGPVSTNLRAVRLL